MTDQPIRFWIRKNILKQPVISVGKHFQKGDTIIYLDKNDERLQSKVKATYKGDIILC